MPTNVMLSRAVRTALFTAGVATALHSQVALAQGVPAAEAAAEPQTIVVTGSRIARPELEAPAPILSIGEEQLKSQGLRNFSDIAAQTPQFAASFGSSRTQSTFSGAATSGLNLVNLRNLGSLRTLVLLNGRRIPGGTTTGTSVDFATLPTANIDRVEVLTGGASAVYGADAVSGAINIVTKKIDGMEFGATYSMTEENDNKNPGGYFILGTNLNDRGYGQVTVQYEDQGLVSCRDRYLCSDDFFWDDPTATPGRGPAVRSAVGANAKFQLGGVFYTSRNGSFTDANGALIPFSTPTDGYNRNADRTLAIPTERLMVAAAGDYELVAGGGATAFTELNFGKSETDAPFEGHPFNSAAAGSLFGGGPGVAGLPTSIPVNNPFIPDAFRSRIPATATAINWQQRFNQFGDRGATNERKTMRAVAGLKGEFTSFLPAGDNFNWEVSHVYGRTDLDSLTDGLVGTDKLYYSLRVETDPSNPSQLRCTNAAARAAGCIPVNPFAPYTQAMKDYLNTSAGQSGRSTLQDTTAFIGAPIFTLPAGAVRAVVGLERRSFSGFLDYDDVINNALATGNQIGDVSKVTTITKELFTEINVPIMKDNKFAEDLQLNGSYRRSNPNFGGDYNTWATGLVWEPLVGVRLRGNYARSVRTPVPGELSGIGQDFGVVDDPCADTQKSAIAAQNCAADGVPVNYNPPQAVQQGVGGFVGGNPDLNPERGASTTIGVVFTPRLVEGLSLSVDHFKIDLKDAINTVGRQLKTSLCYDTVERLFCEDVVRGTNVNLPGANYVLNSVNDQNINVGRFTIGGFDIEAGYRFDLNRFTHSETDFGAVSLHAIMTIYDQADEVPLPGQDTIDLLGFAGGSTNDQGFIKRQGVLDTGYRLGRVSANWHMRYIGSTNMSPFLEEGFPKIGTFLYHDLRLGFAFKEKSEVYFGITNLTDKDPPFFASGASGTQALDTIPAYYDIFGRSYFAGASVRF